MTIRRLRAQIEPELGELDTDLAVEARRFDPIEQLGVVLRDRVRLGQRGEVLAEPRVLRDDAVGRQGPGCRQRIVDGFTGHEPPDGTAHEPETG
jgi:hypothetical protein